MEIPEVAISLIIGLLVCLFGFRIKKFGFFIVWFILGYSLTSTYMPDINKFIPQIADSALYQTLLPICGGLLLGLISFSAEKVCISLITLILTIAIGTKYFGTSIETLAISAIIGVVLGGIAIALIKPAIILTTSISGAYAITTSLIAILNISKEIFFFPILVLIALFGILFQFSKTKGEN